MGVEVVLTPPLSPAHPAPRLLQLAYDITPDEWQQLGFGPDLGGDSSEWESASDGPAVSAAQLL